MNNTIKKIARTILDEKSYLKLQKKRRLSVLRKNNLKREKMSKSKKDNLIKSFLNNWKKTMFELNICDKFDKIITPYDLKVVNNYGSSCIACKIDFPIGKSIKDLEKAIPSLAENVFGAGTRCLAYLEVVEHKKGSYVMFSAVNNWHDKPYEPIMNLSPSQVYLGDDINLDPIILDLSKLPHILITGSTGGGKSKLVEVMITNMALNSTPEELELYFIQASKNDNMKFELLRHCKGCIVASSSTDEYDKFNKIISMLEYINDEINRRGDLVIKTLGRRAEDININEFNKAMKNKDLKMPVLFLLIDEAATMNKETSDKELNRMVKRVKELCERISATGRFVGVYETNALQRASKDELSREVKINTTNWISFKQMDSASSQLAIGDEKSALGLPHRVFACKQGSGIRYAKTPFSAWDKAVKKLEEQDKIKKEDENQFLLDYSHWLEPAEKKETVDVSKENKLLSSELSNYQKSIDSLTEKISELEFELKAKDLAIQKTMKENRMLKTNKDSETIEEEEKMTLESIRDLSYVSCKDQKEKMSEVSDSDYVSPPLVACFKKTKLKVD